MEGLILSNREQRRVQVLNKVLVKEWGVAQAAKLIGVGERQVWRLLAAYRSEGVAGLVHGNRGRHPPQRTLEVVRERVVALATGRYDGANDSHFTELLHEREGMTLSRPTVRRILRGAGIRSPKRRRPPKHRSRRERFPQEGMLLQVDGSYHAWLEERGPWLTLVAGIDDATGTVPAAVFREREDSQGYFLLLRDVLERKGIPQALYSDRHSIFQRSAQEPESLEEQLAGERRPTQFGEALQTLGIGLILAHSPQAKGRIERLWGTLQSRLVTELRLAGARTVEEANRVLQEYLPKFNSQFAVPAAQGGSAYRGIEPHLDLNGILCFKYYRTVAGDNTVTLGEMTLQLLPGADRVSYARSRVEIQERLDGSVVVCHHGRVIATREAPSSPVTLRGRRSRGLPGGEQGRRQVWGSPRHEAAHLPAANPPQPSKPGPNHPWRRRAVLTKSLTS